MAMPILEYKSVKTSYEDNEIKTKFDTGRVVARKKFTKTRRTLKLGVVITPPDLVSALATHYEDVGTVKKFSFTNPATNEVLQVRFGTPIEYDLSSDMSGYYNVADLELVEVI